MSFLRGRAGILLLVILVVALSPSEGARADFFSSSPGPLAQPHAHIDGKDHCQDCHVGSRELTNDKCIACHKPVGERQAARKGLHASTKALGRQCQLCHTDHKGKSKDILGWSSFGGKDKFDHPALTGFPLDGKHAPLTCEKCHTQKTATGTTTYLKTSPACASCHNNPHGDLREALKKCERCHDAKSWKQIEHAQFDHNRDARYPIETKHEGVKCAACHAKSAGSRPPKASKTAVAVTGEYAKLTFRWATWSTDCTPCHDNVHGQSLFGQKACKLCHSAKVEFPRTNFDHTRRTRFALDGQHAKTSCYTCHKKDEHGRPERKCEACHADVHKDRFDKIQGGDCGACHTATNFTREMKFDHGRTKFMLTGAHANADCRSCHRGKTPAEWERFENIVTKVGKNATTVACMSCHKHENVHKKQYTDDKCLDCHKMAGLVDTKPRAIQEFHGVNSKFPLNEGHKGVACEKCHQGNVFTGAPLQCGTKCHADDLHKGTLGTDCLNCHSGGKWEARLFDHDTKTKWPLVGNHREVLCDSCHPRRDFAANRGLSRTCHSCHKKDDAHSGALGTHCENCHIPTGELIFNHNDKKVSDWPLEGKHNGLPCSNCHTTIQFKPTPRDCGPCHAEPQVHKGQLGTLCASCHDAKNWKSIRTGHQVPSPAFGGAHDRVACVKCHPGGRLLAGTGNLCVTCHRQDDVHNNALGPRCGDCHTQQTFAAARFDHTRVGCDLTGVHRVLPCASCHVGGNFTALSPTCISCHRDDAVRAQTVSPGHIGYTTCTQCHNANYFKPQTAGAAKESVCR